MIYTEATRKSRPQTYIYECLGTKLTYRFNTYKIADPTEEELITHTNPFALVIIAARIASACRKIINPEQRDHYALKRKLDLIKLLISKKLDKQKESKILRFILHYIHLENEYIKVKFAIEVDKLTQIKNTMGIEETIISMAKEEGMLEGKLEGKLEEALAIAIKMKKSNFDINLIAEITNLPIQVIQSATA